MHVIIARLHHRSVLLLGWFSMGLGILHWSLIGAYLLFLFLPWAIHPLADWYETWGISDLWGTLVTMAVISLGFGMLFIMVPLGLFGTFFFFLGRGLMHHARWARRMSILLCVAMVALHVAGMQQQSDYVAIHAMFAVLYMVTILILALPVRSVSKLLSSTLPTDVTRTSQ